MRVIVQIEQRKRNETESNPEFGETILLTSVKGDMTYDDAQYF